MVRRLALVLAATAALLTVPTAATAEEALTTCFYVGPYYICIPV